MQHIELRGAIVLAAYQPDPILFARQLRSLQAQTVTNWECVISVDGDAAGVREVVDDVAAGDSRFRVIADGRRLGFYLNFERGLRYALADAAWIALCDQDDYWYPEKLESLLPHLDQVSLVSGQARLVTYPGDETTGYTNRRDLGQTMTMLSNQFTGSLCVLSADLATKSVPFPRMSTRAAAHDHWLGVLAGSSGGTRIVDDVVQDYVQHASNVFGDPSRLTSSNPLSVAKTALKSAKAFTRRFEGSASPAAALRMLFKIYVGWRQLMAETLKERAPEDDGALQSVFGPDRRFRSLWLVLREARRTSYIERRFELEYIASWIAGILVRGRAAIHTEAGDQTADDQEIPVE